MSGIGLESPEIEETVWVSTFLFTGHGNGRGR